MQRRTVSIPCGNLRLEGVLHLPQARTPLAGAVVCHPHPEYGGTMDNSVVLGVTEVLAGSGLAVLRFNFRGVGRSGGAHGGGEPEVQDVRAALDFLSSTGEVAPKRLVVAGYSFGAWVGLRAGCEDPRVQALVAVAPPLVAYPMDYLASCAKPKFALVGTRDTFCPLGTFESWFQALPDPKEQQILQGADHFFLFREGEVGRGVAGYISAIPCF